MIRTSRYLINVIIGGILLVPPVFLFQKVFGAAVPTSIESDLLITHMPDVPNFDQMERLDFPVIATYVMSKGEDIWRFCKRNKLNLDSVRTCSDLDVLTFSGPTIVKIPNSKGSLYRVTNPESLDSISKGYQRGIVKGNHFKEEILAANDFPPPDFKDSEHRFAPGTILFLPSVLKPVGYPPPPFQTKIRISSGYGMRRHPVLGITKPHRGIDIPRPYGEPVHAARRGMITQAGWVGGYGNMVEIRHTNHSGAFVYTRYGHLSKITVHEGQSVRLGTLIGLVGSTGISTGPHLHYEVRDESGRANNPSLY